MYPHFAQSMFYSFCSNHHTNSPATYTRSKSKLKEGAGETRTENDDAFRTATS